MTIPDELMIANQKAANWEKLTPAERRVEIAKDALKQVIAAKYRIKSGTGYIAPAIEKTTMQNDFEGFVDSRDVTEDDLNVIQKNCTLCARGALLLSRVRLFNELSFMDLGIYASHDTADKIYVGTDDIETSDGLYGAFSVEQLELIERAFEKWGSDSDRDAFAFGKSYSHDDDRLIAILNNIIANDGEFIPPPAPEVTE